MNDKKPAMTTQTEKPFEDEVEKPPEGKAPTPDDAGDAQREKDAAKTTQRTE